MGEHKTNPRVQAMEDRPRCGSCPHWLPPPTGDVGECTYFPYGLVALAPRQDAIGRSSVVPTTFIPPKRRDQFCGQHPEFMRWYLAHRNDVPVPQTTELAAAIPEGKA